MAKLTPESPRLFRPTLAAWIGLNESIFLEQLNFILTDTDKGRFADGRKWYRDTPRAFMIQYFPFWDESIVKRTIANLRADALILARSDLNDDHKDRSLWYTINYPTLERLDGPVARITGKSDKRKAARQARKTGADEVPGRYSQPEYTKVQNVLIKSKGTNSTLDGVQNVPLPQVQNVPTPKESLRNKDLKTKEGESPPFGPLTQALADICKLNRETIQRATGKELFATQDAFNRIGITPAQVLEFDQWRKAHHWSGKKGNDPPSLKQVGEFWGQYEDWVKRDRPDPPTQPQNGANYGTHQSNSRKGIKALEETGESLANERTIDIYTREYVYPDGRRESIDTS